MNSKVKAIFFDVGNTLLFPNRERMLAPIAAAKHPSLAEWQALERRTKQEFDQGLISGKIDHLRGLKENVIMGRLIPAGTGLPAYKHLDIEVETLPGVRLGHRNIPVNSVGAYVPGGRYPMVASAHMSIVTAKVAGVSRVAAATPPLNDAPPAATIAAMVLGGADEIYVMGGVQAVAALALGTETIKAVDMLVGPGNAYVCEAKRQVFGRVGIDSLPGPSELMVVADETAAPDLAAADLLAQAEHGSGRERIWLVGSSAVLTAIEAEAKAKGYNLIARKAATARG